MQQRLDLKWQAVTDLILGWTLGFKRQRKKKKKNTDSERERNKHGNKKGAQTGWANLKKAALMSQRCGAMTGV